MKVSLCALNPSNEDFAMDKRKSISIGLGQVRAASANAAHAAVQLAKVAPK